MRPSETEGMLGHQGVRVLDPVDEVVFHRGHATEDPHRWELRQ